MDLLLPLDGEPCAGNTEDELARFDAYGTSTTVTQTRGIPVYTNQFWTAKQRAGHPLHEVPYRACFKPQLPRFFIELLTKPGDAVYDPFAGRGTTPLEAALLGRVPFACDVNPLSEILLRPRLEAPTVGEVEQRLADIDLDYTGQCPEDLLVFYHPDTLREICALRAYLLARRGVGTEDRVDRWIRMVTVSRLTGHSPGFLSIYTLPPNQAVSVESQRRINRRRNQLPPRRYVRDAVLGKSRDLLRDCDAGTRRQLREVGDSAVLLTGESSSVPEIAPESIQLVVTSPPFLDVVDYAKDNWLRCWFCGINTDRVPITVSRRVHQWQTAMRAVLAELARVVRVGGHVAFEVGEVKRGEICLEECVLDAVAGLPLSPRSVVVNVQEFTKTAHCWGVQNNQKGTNTNRIVLLRRV